MAATRRLQKELVDLEKSGNKSFRNVQVYESNLLVWHKLLVPDKAPYKKVAFLVDLVFPAEYLFKPPKVSYRTKISHPYIDENGQVCLPIISAEKYKPATKVEQVIESLVCLVNDPEPDHRHIAGLISLVYFMSCCTWLSDELSKDEKVSRTQKSSR
eukprot:GFUD01073835.1.p1 GENE.GFUD01073835.1~~GFUD01073835.1.p1  ORF type:complete len:167 (-),score=20.91 GFUD01073835.1:91-561(-)